MRLCCTIAWEVGKDKKKKIQSYETIEYKLGFLFAGFITLLDIIKATIVYFIKFEKPKIISRIYI